uniref:Globin family profile domain-containing protein n=1 Tax=Wuchereria bancrofti TaxID=6293 RepID=A0A1I8EQM2_WUCBA
MAPEYLLKMCREAQQLFSFMNLDLYNCRKKNNDFVFQALRFIQKARQFQPSAPPLQVLESGINSLDDLKAFHPILDNLGRRHGKLESSSGFRLSVFLECSIHHVRLALLSSKVDRWNNTDVDNVVILWRYLISGICERIKRGYLTNIADRSMLDVQAEAASKVRLSVIPPILQPSAKNPANSARMPIHYQFIR